MRCRAASSGPPRAAARTPGVSFRWSSCAARCVSQRAPRRAERSRPPARRLPGVSRIVAAPVARVRARCRQAGAPRRKPRAAMAAPNARSPAISTLERPFSRCRKGLELR
ncbi:hypothetical protein BURPS406E_H0499 [Burkholderia pseudomallei 406e]|uniref:Uncharacterized protein n=1 Tax=Burkholderia pseudomallei (strain 1106a) TaxID=357348 RepID=A3NWN8_BURP0|nr:hypothetical protein BURPS1106A_2500 [Burkholderia pseudomallei 1106a]EDO84134.1 hypothetical protein BURPS406E_H0499 [Burkholderia pseudomallei 406e]EEH24957.1 hypothetical protein BUH_2492 [Burkholderia pseudomallei Pakistan 9]